MGMLEERLKKGKFKHILHLGVKNKGTEIQMTLVDKGLVLSKRVAYIRTQYDYFTKPNDWCFHFHKIFKITFSQNN